MNFHPRLLLRLPKLMFASRGGVVLILIAGVFLVMACTRLPFFNNEPEPPASASFSVTFDDTDVESLPNSMGLASSLRSLEDKILFKSNRDGEERLYVMDADGSNQRPFAQESLYLEAAKLEAFSPTRDRQAVVQRFGNGQYLFVRELQTEIRQQIAGGPWVYYAPAWAPNDHQIAYVAEIEGRPIVHLLTISSGDSSILVSPSIGTTSHPTWSPSGDRLAITVQTDEQRQIWTVYADGSAPTNLSNNRFDDWDPIWIKAGIAPQDSSAPTSTDQISISWNVDGCLFRIEAVDRTNGEFPISQVQVITIGGVKYDSGPIAARDFRETRLLALPPGTHPVELRIWNAGRYKEQPLTLGDTLFCYSGTPTPEAMPTPTALVVEPTPEPANIFDAATRVAMGQRGSSKSLPIGAVIATTTPQPVVITNTPTPENAATLEYERSFATAMAATTGTPTPLPGWWITATPTPTDTPTPLPTDTPVSVPWAPRGVVSRTPVPTPTAPFPSALRGKILFQSDRDGRTEIYAMNPDGSDIQKLTAAWPYDQALAEDTISSDGIYRIYVNRTDDSFQIFFHDAQFNVDERVSLLGAGDAWDPAVEPTGWRVAFVSNEPGNDELYVVNRDGSGLVRLTHNEWEWDRHPSWSPDGAEIVFWSNRSGHKQLYIISADGSTLRLLSDGFANDWDPVWVK